MIQHIESTTILKFSKLPKIFGCSSLCTKTLMVLHDTDYLRQQPCRVAFLFKNMT